MDVRFKHNFIGPYQFLILCLLISESSFAYWMYSIKPEEPERIVIGTFSLSVLIAVLVIFCVIFSIKKKRDASEILKLKFVNNEIELKNFEEKLKFVNSDMKPEDFQKIIKSINADSEKEEENKKD